jgi:hypothetical protein
MNFGCKLNVSQGKVFYKLVKKVSEVKNHVMSSHWFFAFNQNFNNFAEAHLLLEVIVHQSLEFGRKIVIGLQLLFENWLLRASR